MKKNLVKKKNQIEKEVLKYQKKGKIFFKKIGIKDKNKPKKND